MVMTNGQIESWVWDVVTRLRAGDPIEDARVELKGDWIEPSKAARRLAGHANAARGEQILWIVGLDESAADPVAGVSDTGLSDWWSKVRSCFDELAPEVRDINVPVDGRTLVALLVDTSRPPYVVKNPDFGVLKTAMEVEVPWREGTRTRSARRNELLRLAMPLMPAPEIDVLGYRLTHSRKAAAPENSPGTYRLEIQLYLRLPPLDAPLVYPDHDTWVYGGVGSGAILFRDCKVVGGGSAAYLDASTVTAHRGQGQLIVDGSGPVMAFGTSSTADDNAAPDPSEDAWAEVVAQAIGANRPLAMSVKMPFLGEESKGGRVVRRWGLRAC